ncbi:plakophilin-1 [Paramisgurnus dabryanus]|uniref:plakophilin-1 n=1 Tax=Paramisgurnus dabryanus TaxID=90735 RepID=UPI0031F3FA47
MMADPLRSARSTSTTEDTSLVLPSDKSRCTGQQRVMQQVNSIKRSKSKIVRNDSSQSPTSQSPATEYSEPKFQFSPTKMNGSLFRKSSTNMSRRQSRMNGYSESVRKTVRRQIQSTSQFESQMQMETPFNGIKPSGSDPTLNHAAPVMTQRGNLSRAATYHVKSSGSSHSLTKPRSKSEALSTNDLTAAFAGITLKDAVEYLKRSDDRYQLCGASFIQHHTFAEDITKNEVWRLGGIPVLIQLLKTDNTQLQQTAAAALRNVVFKDLRNKLQVESCGGLEVIRNVLASSNDTETQKHLTGLLWNLSSANDLKPKLVKSVLPQLTESIVVPYSGWPVSNTDSTDKHIEPEVFENTTGCIRNLSSASEEERIAMRNCPGLIDSLMTYVKSQVERYEHDDKTLENCVCVLHNLSFHLETEAPESFSIPDEFPQDTSKQSLFSPKNSKIQKDISFPSMDKKEPKGVSWLYHKKSLQLYLTLLSYSTKEATLEACCGALQNLTASKNTVSTLMSKTIVEKLNGLPFISPLLNSANPSLQRTAVSLVGNMSRVSELRGALAKEVLPHLSSLLCSVDSKTDDSDYTISSACRVMHTLMLSKPELSKKVLTKDLIDSLSDLSRNMTFTDGRRAAGVLLYSMWGEKDIHNMLKKQGMNKYTFINEVTAASYKIVTSKIR